MTPYTRNMLPPWVLFMSDGKPDAILPAGRLGSVADVRGLPVSIVRVFIAAANSGTLQDPIADAKALESLSLWIQKAKP